MKATLVDSYPPVWRRIHVRGDMNLRDLHFVLQLVMGWMNNHLHQFKIGGRIFADPYMGGGNLDAGQVDEVEVLLNDVVRRVGQRILYFYDFGDGWKMELRLESVMPADEGARYPRCLDGERNAPPEDVGGLHGFDRFVAVMGDPKHKDHRAMTEWHGRSYDPEEFPLERINAALRKRFPAPKRKKLAARTVQPGPRIIRPG